VVMRDTREDQKLRETAEFKQMLADARREILSGLNMTPEKIKVEEEAQYRNDINSGDEKRIAIAKARKEIMDDMGS